jgi:hypothetical protein
MQAKKRLAKEIDSLDTHDILRVYDLVSTLKNKEKRVEPLKKGYLRARLALKNCKGSLSDDIIKERTERI